MDSEIRGKVFTGTNGKIFYKDQEITKFDKIEIYELKSYRIVKGGMNTAKDPSEKYVTAILEGVAINEKILELLGYNENGEKKGKSSFFTIKSSGDLYPKVERSGTIKKCKVTIENVSLISEEETFPLIHKKARLTNDSDDIVPVYSIV